MFLGITLLGWITIGGVYLPFLSALALWRGKRLNSSRTLIVFGAALLPLAAAVGEALYVEARFVALCKEGAGIQVLKRVGAEGYFDSGSRDWSKSPGDFAKTGFGYIEWQGYSKSFYRIERRDGDVVVLAISRPTARYAYFPPTSEHPLSHSITETEEKVVDLETQEVVGRVIRIYRYPAFVDRLWWQYFDPVPMLCPKTTPNLRDGVLLPVHP